MRLKNYNKKKFKWKFIIVIKKIIIIEKKREVI